MLILSQKSYLFCKYNHNRNKAEKKIKYYQLKFNEKNYSIKKSWGNVSFNLLLHLLANV